MESKLNDLTVLIGKLTSRINTAKENNIISTIETDIMLDLLRQAYLTTEQLKKDAVIGYDKRSSSSQAIIPEIKEPIRPEPLVSVEPENDIPVSESPHEQMEVQPVYSPTVETPVEHVPQMSFPKVEVVTSENSYVSAASHPVLEPTEIYIAPSQPAAPIIQDVPSMQQPIHEHEPAERRQEAPAALKNQKMPGDLFGMPTIADKLKSEAPSVLDKINQGKHDQTLAHKMQLTPIDDLKNAIGINEKFQFVNDLFEGRIELYNDAISRLNSCDSVNNAENIFEGLKSTHGWNENTEACHKLKSFINRRYL